MTTRFFTRLTIVFVALIIGYSSTFSAFADSRGKVQRLRERASVLEEIGKIKKSQKRFRAADEAERRAERKYERALKNKKDGKIGKYAKRIRKAQRLNRDVAKTDRVPENKQAVEFKEDGKIAEYVEHLQSAGRVSGGFLEWVEETLFSSTDEDVSGKDASLPPKDDDIAMGQMDALELDKEASLGNGEALYLLGEMYQHGIGVDRSLGIAWAMYSLAEEEGIGVATNRLVPLADAMTNGGLATGRKIYDRWKMTIKNNRKKDQSGKNFANSQL